MPTMHPMTDSEQILVKKINEAIKRLEMVKQDTISGFLPQTAVSKWLTILFNFGKH